MSVQRNLSFFGDPAEMALTLVRENGLHLARQIAVEGTTDANTQGDYYSLSVWREVKGILREWTEELPPAQGTLPDQIEASTIKDSLTIPPVT